MTPLWESPITNRSEEDLKKPEGIGYLNAADLNRIESNTSYVADKLNAYLYEVHMQEQPKTDWKFTDIPDTGDIWRICSNLTAIKKAFFIPEEVQDLQNKRLHYEDINQLEKILLLHKLALDWMTAGFKQSGTFKAGCRNERVFLPKRRMQ